MPLTSATFLALALVAAPPAWSKVEMKELLSKVQQAAAAQSVEQQDAALLQVAAQAYRHPPKGGGMDHKAKDILRHVDPEHPAVKKGQWMLALSRRFYLDAHKRLDTLGRFETNMDDERWLKNMSNQTLLVAREIEKSLELVVEGLAGGTEPLPNVGGEKPIRRGAMVKVHNGGDITIEEMKRVTFEGHQPPEDRARTANGSLRELYSAQKQYLVSAQMLGKYDKLWRKNNGHVQVVIPAAYPAIYLNEIARASKEAKMKHLHLLTMSKRGELRELNLLLQPPKATKRRRKKKAPAFREVSCKDTLLMQDCARRLVHGLGQGLVVYDVD